MKHYLLYFIIIFCFSLLINCNKNNELLITNKKPESCDFLQGKYNFVARMSPIEQEIAFRKGVGNTRDTDKDGIVDSKDNCKAVFNPDQLDVDKDGVGDACDTIKPIDTTVVNPPNIIKSWVVLLDFDGCNVNTPYWNQGIPFYATPSGMSSVEINNIVIEVKKDYAQFPVTITTDTLIYFAANPYKRQRIVITAYNEWYGGSGGVAYIGGIDWGGGQNYFGEVPAFVFSKALSYSQKNVGEASSHEAGHAIGLYHQIQCSSTGTFLTEYSNGGSASLTAPIMGVSYYKPGEWWIGPNSFGCINIQNDSLIIRQKVGY
jgi:hypothetical protein